jgi:hypothetical protein
MTKSNFLTKNLLQFEKSIHVNGKAAELTRQDSLQYAEMLKTHEIEVSSGAKKEFTIF